MQDGKTVDPANHAYDLEDFYAAVKAGNFPAVSYIKMPAFQDGHAGNSDPLDEQAGNVELINFLQKQPEWSETAVIITYDDSDGWYDHHTLAPTSASYDATADQVNGPGLCGLGPQQAAGAEGPQRQAGERPLRSGHPRSLHRGLALRQDRTSSATPTSRRRPWCGSSKTTGCTASVSAAVRSTPPPDRSWTCSTSTTITATTIRTERAVPRSDRRHGRSSARRTSTTTTRTTGRHMNSRTLWLLGAGLLSLAGAVFAVETQGLAEANPAGANPNPVRLMRPPVAPLSAMAQLGKQIFYDASLSSSGALSCASCHSPDHAYGPPNDGPVMLGGPDLSRQGARAVPSLTYLERQPEFQHRPGQGRRRQRHRSRADGRARPAGRARDKDRGRQRRVGANIVPQGGLFWDGRADTLQDQALFPLLDPNEMDGGSAEIVADKLRHAPYAQRFVELFGAGILTKPRLLICGGDVRRRALSGRRAELPSLHQQVSTTGWRARRGCPRANCAACNCSTIPTRPIAPAATPRRRPATACRRCSPTTNTRRSARRAMPRSPTTAIPNYFDLGVCGPQRTDIAEQTQYCGMFLTPTLRNTATRHAFFHNGVFRTLEQVMDFYNFRDTNPDKVYPARRRRRGAEIRRPAAKISCQCRRHRSAVRSPPRRQAGDDGSGRSRHHRLPEDADGRLQGGELGASVSAA